MIEFFKKQYHYGKIKRYIGMTIIKFSIFNKFKFSWSTDCGDWFVYFIFRNKNKVTSIRFSNMGFYKHKYIKDISERL